jgi:hypothetical protein
VIDQKRNRVGRGATGMTLHADHYDHIEALRMAKDGMYRAIMAPESITGKVKIVHIFFVLANFSRKC